MTAPIVRDFPNIERLLALGLFAPMVGGADHVGTETPDDLEDRLPFVRVNRTGGARTHLLDYPIVEISYFDADELTGYPRASQLLNTLIGKPPPHPSIDVAYCDTGFRELPWFNEEVRHWGATVSIETRRVRVQLLP